jgi:SpoVK/Ycf46/Vps4 family AAA+-type ATPase
MNREQLEQHLLTNPLDVEARASYAEILFSESEFAASLDQWRLILQQGAGGAEAYIRAAQCCLATGDGVGAGEHLAKARTSDGFDAGDPRIAEIEKGTGPQRLRVVEGQRRAAPDLGEIISITTVDEVRFRDVVGMENLKKTLRMRIIEPFMNPGLFEKFRKRSGGGVLLYGPPGCGKTLVARAIATECRATFTAVGISDILNMWIGESERNLAAIFDKARSEAPAVLFFDELDALALSRSKAHSDHTRTLVNEFLAQLDGMSGSNEKVLILSATNMPWDVDEAMKRPGRFDRQIFVPPPDAEARAEMFRVKLQDVPVGELDYEGLGTVSAHFSGADIDGVIDHAKEVALADILESGEERPVTQSDLLEGLETLTPSTLEWLKTARNLVKFGGGGRAYEDVEKYLRKVKLY